PGPDAPRGGAGPEHRRGAVPVTDGARGRVWRQGRSIELLQLLRRDPGLFPEGLGAVRPRDAGGGTARRADLSHGRPPGGTQCGAPGEAGAGGETMTADGRTGGLAVGGRRASLALAAGFLGAQLNTAASFDAASASIHVPKRRLEGALDLLADVVLRPSFADSEVARQRQLRAAQLVQQRDEPVAVANVVFPAIVYGPEHPYGHPLNGTDSATARLARERVAEFYRSYYRPNGGRILVVGDVTLAEARRLVTARFGGWERGDVPAFPSAPAPASAARTV